jgi:hypothetical protein
MKKRWSISEVLILILQVLTPVAAIYFTYYFPFGKEQLTEEIKLTIIGAGILIPIILLQVTITNGQNKSDRDNQKLESTTRTLVGELHTKMDYMSDKLNHISPILERVFLSGNDRTKRFVYRRMEEVAKTINTALNNNNSGILKPSEYYEELLYLADLIIKDHAEMRKNFTGEVWAMTSFADEEWVVDEGYEKLWTEKLTDIVDTGIKTRRLCIVPDNIYQQISAQPFSQQNAWNIKAFKGFFNYLETYYGQEKRKKTVENYFLRSNENQVLTGIKGFFAIKLSSGELHILHGETVNENGAISAQVLFDDTEITNVRRLFDRYARPSLNFEKAISDATKNNDFLIYLQDNNINF